MPAPTRIYVVTSPAGGDSLIRSVSPAQAVRHAARDFEARVAEQDDLVRLLGAGVPVEVAGEEPAAEGEAA